MKRTKSNKKSRTLKEKVLIYAAKQQDERRQRERDIFKRLKPKKVNFSMARKMEHYVYLPKSHLEQMSSSELAVYPVLCCNADFRKINWFQMSQQNIADYAGISLTIARKGINRLIDRELLKKRKITIHKVHMFEYEVLFIRGFLLEKKEIKNDILQFYAHLISDGTWAKLSPEEKQLYITMRRSASFNEEIYAEIECRYDMEGIELSDFYANEYSSRKWDVLCTDNEHLMINLLCYFSGISPDKLGYAIVALEDCGLIEQTYSDETCFKVYLRKGKY